MGKEDTSLACKVISYLFLGLVLAFVGIGIYVGYVAANASSPSASVASSKFQVGYNGAATALTYVNGTTVITVQNGNKVALTINGASFPTFWPSTGSGAVYAQQQVGTFTFPTSVVAAGTTQNITFTANINNFSNAQGIGMVAEQVGGSTNFLVNGTATADARVAILKLNADMTLSCIIAVQANGNATPSCTITAGKYTTSAL
eukprot:TRINITY_DN72432_c0_g1_i1.p1 TRINITY_DN72432_c0_g1~~TRINITY_DN72432_c0_g1_i1.p1  ORF type:complete len:233 (-),score=58.72 TRINITY_DN72432_c0_g1_i1:41-649(-)